MIIGVLIILNTNVMVIKQNSVSESYLYNFRPYLRDILNDLKQSDTWKIQLTIAINFISSKNDNDEEWRHRNKKVIT